MTMTAAAGHGGDAASSSTTLSDRKTYNIFVGDLDPATTEEELFAAFLPLGEIDSVHVHHGRRQGDKNYGFVHFVHKHSKEAALKPPWCSVPIRGVPCCTRVAEGKHRSKRALYLTSLSPKAPTGDPVLLAKALSLLFNISITKVAATDSPATCWKIVFPSHQHSSQAFAKLSAGVFYGEPLHVHWHEPQNLQVARFTPGSAAHLPSYFAHDPASEPLELSFDRAMAHDRAALLLAASHSSSSSSSLDTASSKTASLQSSASPALPPTQAHVATAPLCAHLPSAQTVFPHQPHAIAAGYQPASRMRTVTATHTDVCGSNSFASFANWIRPTHAHYQLFQSTGGHPVFRH